MILAGSSGLRYIAGECSGAGYVRSNGAKCLNNIQVVPAEAVHVGKLIGGIDRQVFDAAVEDRRTVVVIISRAQLEGALIIEAVDKQLLAHQITYCSGGFVCEVSVLTDIEGKTYGIFGDQYANDIGTFGKRIGRICKYMG